MKHLFTRWLTCMVAFMALAAASPGMASASDGPRFLYVAGATDLEPLKIYADAWESFKIYETSPGSNIYEGRFNLNKGIGWGGNFRFYYDLSEDRDLCWRQNVIYPDMSNGYRMVFSELGRSGVVADHNVSVSAMFPGSPGTWWVAPGYYKIHLDLNKKDLYAIPEGTVLMLINDNSTPTLETLANYVEISRVKDYVEAGEMNISLYNFDSEMWYNPNGSRYLELNRTTCMRTMSSTERGEPFTIAETWNGGVVTGYEDQYVSIAPDKMEEIVKPLPQDLDCIYVVGGFTQWNFTAVPRESGEEAIYKVVVPPCSDWDRQFKLLLDADWSADYLVYAGETTTIGDYQQLSIKAGLSAAQNHDFTHDLLVPEILEVNLTRGTITVLTSAGLLFYAADGGSSQPLDRDVLLVETPYDNFTPWSDCSDTVFGSFPSLARQADGTYAGEIEVPAGKFNLRFISGLSAKGMPNTVIAPPTGKDRALAVVDGVAMSSAASLAADKAGFWTRSDWAGGKVNVTVTPGANPSVNFNFPSDRPKDEIYLIGEPQASGWDVSDGSLALQKTDRGGYYGSFYIDASCTLFRFYTELGNWGSDGELPSIGPRPVDGEIESVSLDDTGNYTGSCTPGKGIWSIDNWEGGKMYIYVDLEAMRVHFSASPIEEAGTVIDPNAPIAPKTGVFIWQDGSYGELNEVGDGVYEGVAYSGELRLFTRQLPISTEEPEWEGSYALSAPAPGTEFELDDLFVGESTFTTQDGVNRSGANAFFLPMTPGGYSITVDLNKGKIYLEARYMVTYLVGALTDGKVPTYETRGEFRHVAIPNNGGIVDIPAGKMDFAFLNGIYSSVYTPGGTATPVFTDGFASAEEHSFQYGWSYSRVVCDSWHGGKVYVSGHRMLDMSVVGSVKAMISDNSDRGSAVVTLGQTAPGSLVYKGEVPFAPLDRADLRHMLSFVVRDGETSVTHISVGSDKYNMGTGAIVNDGAEIMVPVDGVATAASRFGGWSLRMPTLVGSGVMDVTLDLNTMTTTVKVSEDNTGSIYEAVADEGSDLDGAVAYPSTTQEDAVTVAVEVAPQDGGHEFNFTSPDGSVIEPAGGAMTQIEFDANGSWSGPFVKKPSASKARAALRAKAAGEAKWHFDMPEGLSSSVSMLIDEKSGKLTVYSSAHNSNFFIVSFVNYQETVMPVVENLDLLKQNVLTETAPGIFEGDLDIPADADNFNVAFANTLYSSDGSLRGIGAVSWERVFDLSGENAEASCYAYGSPANPSYAERWTVTAPEGKVHVRFNAPEYLMTMSRGSMSVNSVTDDGVELAVIPGEGCVTVISPAAVRVDFHSLSGALVRSVNAQEGSTVVDMPAGFYIVNRTKIFVK